MRQDITIWVPTKNRPEFLRRLLTYYANTGFSGDILIGDSSAGEALEKNQTSIAEFSAELNIDYQRFPKLGQGHVSAKLVTTIETKYATFLSDDDLIVTESINPIVRTLDATDRASGMNGAAVTFRVAQDSAWGMVNDVSPYELAYLPQPTATERLKTIFGSVKNSNMCIYRTAHQKNIFQKVSKLSEYHSNAIFEELLGAAIVSARGQVRTHPGLFLCRQQHAAQFYGGIDLFDWFTDAKWHSAFKLLEETFVTELEETGEMEKEEARKYFTSLFRPYIINVIVGMESRHQAQVQISATRSFDNERRKGMVLHHLNLLEKKVKRLMRNRKYQQFTELSSPEAVMDRTRDFGPIEKFIENGPT